MKATHGFYLPEGQLNHVVRSGRESFELRNGKLITYYIELRNPFASRPEIFLVVGEDGRDRRVNLPWVGKIEAFAMPSERIRWANLSYERVDGDLLLLRTTIDPTRPQSYVIDLALGKARRSEE